MKNDYLKECKAAGKLTFTSEAKANRMIGRYKDINRVYYCGDCDGYHITKRQTHMSKPEKDMYGKWFSIVKKSLDYKCNDTYVRQFRNSKIYRDSFGEFAVGQT